MLRVCLVNHEQNAEQVSESHRAKGSSSDLNCEQSQEARLVEKVGEHQMPLVILANGANIYQHQGQRQHEAINTRSERDGDGARLP